VTGLSPVRLMPCPAHNKNYPGTFLGFILPYLLS